MTVRSSRGRPAPAAPAGSSPLRCLLFAGLLVVLGGCGKSPAAPAAAPPTSASLVGRWVSEPTLSQLGRIVHTYAFEADGTYAASFDFVDAGIPRMDHAGRYERRDGKVRLLPRAGQPSEMTYAIEGDTLVLTEGNGDSYRLRRK